MPKMRMKASEEKKIRRLKQDIKDMKLDMKETFSVMEEMEKPKKSAEFGRKRVFVVIAVIAGGIILAAAVYVFFAAL